MNRLIATVSTAAAFALAILGTIAWLQAFQMLVHAAGKHNLWLWVFLLPLWLATPIVIYARVSRWRRRRHLNALIESAQRDPATHAAAVLHEAISLAHGGYWLWIQRELLPLLELGFGGGAPPAAAGGTYPSGPQAKGQAPEAHPTPLPSPGMSTATAPLDALRAALDAAVAAGADGSLRGAGAEVQQRRATHDQAVLDALRALAEPSPAAPPQTNQE